MLIVAGNPREVREFRDSIDQGCYLVPKITLDLGELYIRVFHRVVQQAGRKNLRRNTQVRKDLGNGKTMIDVRLAGDPGLTPVSLFRHGIGAPN
jgi:hypothetical protein